MMSPTSLSPIVAWKIFTEFLVATKFEKELFWFGILDEKEKSLEMLNYQLDTQFQVYYLSIRPSFFDAWSCLCCGSE